MNVIRSKMNINDVTDDVLLSGPPKILVPSGYHCDNYGTIRRGKAKPLSKKFRRLLRKKYDNINRRAS